MRKSLLYIGVLCLAISSCKDDAELNDIIPFQFSPTSVETAPQSVTLKAEILTEQTIQEKGFILKRTYKSNFNYDNSSMDTIALAADAPFECTITSDMEKGQPCTAFAYIKQNGHYYRNEEVTFVPEGCMPPIISSIFFDSNTNWGNYIIVKGENFSKTKNRNIIKCYKNESDTYAHFNILKVSPTELIISYNIEQTGNAELEIQVGNLKTSISCTLPGPVISSWEPQNPRYGETLTLKLLGFHESMRVSYMTETTHVINDISSDIHIEGELISFPFLSNLEEAYYAIQTQSPRYYIESSAIHTSIPWAKKLKVGSSLHSYCFVNDKLYIDDWRNQDFGQYQLCCYDFQTDSWSYFPYEDINVYNGLHCYMWHKDSYIYVLHILERNEWNPVKIKNLMRFNVQTHEWETRADAPFEAQATGIYHLEDDVYVYLTDECYHYSMQQNKWEKLSGKIDPAIGHIIGEYNGYIYYIAQSGTGEIIRLKTNTTGKGEFAISFSNDWTTGISSAQIIDQNLYYATKKTGIIKYNLINQIIEHLGIPPMQVRNYHRQDYFFFEKEKDLYIIHEENGNLYQYIEDRKNK